MKILALAAALLCVVPVAACDDSKSKDSAEVSAPAARYTVRGRLDAVAKDKIYVFHEAIPGFVNSDGKAVGMPAMQMPFAVGEGVDLSELAVDDELEMTFEVRFSEAEPLKVVAIEELPPETELELGE